MQDEVFVDTVRVCVDCGQSYMFSAGEAAYFRSKSLRTPKRCPACRELRRRTINPDPEARR